MGHILEIPKQNQNRDNNPSWVDNGENSKPSVVCICGSELSLQHHTVMEDGQVSGILHHDSKNCGWYSGVKLNSYKGEFWPKG